LAALQGMNNMVYPTEFRDFVAKPIGINTIAFAPSSIKFLLLQKRLAVSSQSGVYRG